MKHTRKQMGIRLWGILLALALCLCTATGLAQSQRALPGVGDTLHGFTVVGVDEISYLDATTLYMVHENTGAQLIYIANDDTERSFTVGYRTPIDNDKGIPHIFEHSTLCGSEKYPDPNLFFSMISQTYTTFLNAMTMQNCTLYPMSSYSEEQLTKVMDMVLAGLAHPIIMTDERAMMREAYRYELADAAGEITLLGTVYSEMQGALNTINVSPYNLAKLLYPGSTHSMVTGGLPAEIPTMTHQELKDFHDTYYHPSNALMLLYGDLDLDRFLEQIDSTYLSEYTKQEITITDDGYTPVEGYQEGSYTFPASADSAGQSAVVYGFSLAGATNEEQSLLSIATAAMKSEGSPLSDLILERMPNISMDIAVQQDYAEPTLLIMGVGVDANSKELFKQTIDEALAQILENGLDEEQMSALCYRQRVQLGLTREASNVGVNTSMEIISAWARNGDPDAYQASVQVMTHLEQYLAEDAFNTVVRKYLANPPRSALALTVAEAGGLEAAQAALAQELAQQKASMSAEEIDALVQRTADFAAWTEENSKNSMIDQMRAITVSELPEEVIAHQAKDEIIDGMRMITSQVADTDVMQVSLVFDASGIPLQELLNYSLYTNLLTTMPTANHDATALALDLANTMASLNISANLQDVGTDASQPVLTVSWLCTADRLEHAYALIKEILFETDFTDRARVQQYAMQMLLSEQYAVAMQPDAVAKSMGLLLVDPNTQYADLLSGDSYTQLVRLLMQLDDETYASILEQVSNIPSYFARQPGFIATCVGTADAFALNNTQALALYQTLDPQPLEKATYPMEPQPASMAMTYDGSMQFNMMVVPFAETGLDYTAKLDVLQAIAYDRVLLPILRFQNAAYGVQQSIDEDTAWVMSYRDPQLAATYALYPQVGDALRALELTQDEVDGYITNVYSSIAKAPGKMSAGAIAVGDAITGEDSFAKKLQHMQQIKAFTPEDVAAYASVYDTIATQGKKMTVGSVQAVSENRGMFEKIDDQYAPLPEVKSGYQIGDKVEDFTVTLSDGTLVSLYGLLEEKKAVCLNFWASWCGPCRIEFPYLDQAYSQVADEMGLLALSIEPGDTDEIVLGVKEELGITSLPMGRDTAGQKAAYGVSSYPTTIIIDRYGVVCFREEGGIPDADKFLRLFKLFLDDHYPESIAIEEIPEMLPNVELPSSEAMAAALGITDPRISVEAVPYTQVWPFIPGEDGASLVVTNGTVKDSMAAFAIEVTVEAGEALGYTYTTTCSPIVNSLTLYVDNKPIHTYAGMTDWTQDAIIFDAAGTYTVSVIYNHLKDDNATTAALRDVKILSAQEAQALEVVLPPAPAKTLPGTECTVEVVEGEMKEFLAAMAGEEAPMGMYVLQGDSMTVRIKVGEDVRDDLAFVILNDSYAMLKDLEQDEEGYLLSYTTVGQPELLIPMCQLSVYGSVIEGVEGTALQQLIWFNTEEEVDAYLDYFMTMANNNGGDVTCTWRYVDGSPKQQEADAPAAQALPEGTAQYVIQVTDTQGNPLPGATLQICDDATCMVAVTDAAGQVVHVAAAYPYEIHVLQAPEGYTRPSEAYVFPQAGGTITIVLE